MEAASARYAARDRFGGFGEPAQTPLQRYIQNAVDPQNYEPNLALDLEISDLINSKKGNAPREAAVAIVNYVNHRNANVSLLALALLDICVKNCGYPFHLQISTKEFLNELVRRFPERPPIRPSRVQLKILEAIEEWRQTICQTSRYKEDLGFIRDMHRLLSYKGYMFPEVRREDAAVLNPSDNLQSADEMEEEEKAAQSAKLQELIRRGGPEDLQEANRLMKVMAGYDTKHKTDYRAKAAEEVGKIQQKARLLEERLQTFKAGDIVAEGDIFEELANALQSAQPKIQRMCEEESDDQEAVAKLFEINDSIHRTIERYKLIKKGDVDGASKIPQGTLGTSTGVSKTADNELSLIDFSGDLEPTASAGGNVNGSSEQKNTTLQDDLLGLSVQDQDYGQRGGIALGFGANSSNKSPSDTMRPYTNLVRKDVPGPSLLSSTTQDNSAKASAPNATPQPQQALLPAKPNYDPFKFRTSSLPSSRSSTPAPHTLLQTQQAAKPSQPPQSSADPFAALSSAASRTASPLPTSQSIQKPTPPLSASLFDFASPKPAVSQSRPAANSQQATNGTSADDDWDFASALPDDAEFPTHNNLTVSNTSVKIDFRVERPESPDSAISISALFSNNSPSLITEYTLQVAVTKGFTLKLTPQSGRTLQPNQKDGITQHIVLSGVARGQANSAKIRWKASYKVAGDLRQEQGEVPPLGIA
ncbi:MAG: hypothetical protein ALECFALPRED_004244 [Alectoria fallacina]|uniref:ADP-ribosylation factor-binding protein GGA1 n=1 Tax=Alectoria fallacina TaxID=1903189 RepID=A0A8H3FWN8_9LECA|nr:MAG: hypothetical protein ALECFALPRED_004244 [Alectoria fallacina]